MANFKLFQLNKLDELLNENGYTPLIANSNYEFQKFFENLGIDIYKDYNAGSKGKTLHNFWVSSPNELALKVIKEIKEIVIYNFSNDEEKLNKAKYLFNSIETTLSNQLDINSNLVSTIKKYEIIEELKPGGFGDTFLIKDSNLNKLFVLKKYRGEFLKEEDNEAFLNKFLEEINILYDLNHVNIIRIFDYSTKNNVWYIMEYADGGNIEEYLTSKPQDINNLFLQAINVFSFLETKNICHRDIRVNNVLVTKDGILKIIDFGFGKNITNNGTLKNATKLIDYQGTLPKELNCDIPKYDKQTEIYFVGKLFAKLSENNQFFRYQSVVDKMIKEDNSERLKSFLEIKGIIRDYGNKNQIIPKNLKENYQNLISHLDNIITSVSEINKIYNYEEIISNLENLLDKNLLNDYLSSPIFFAECFISNVSGFYPKKTIINISYIQELIKWLKELNDKDKELLIKNLHFKLSTYRITPELPF